VNKQRLQSIVKVGAKTETWPTFFVNTDGGCYEYNWEAFVERAAIPKGRVCPLPPSFLNQQITEVRGDGETAVILLESRDAVVIEIGHRLFQNQILSALVVRPQFAADFQKWEQEFLTMTPLPILPERASPSSGGRGRAV
jgi:hypothetical protein